MAWISNPSKETKLHEVTSTIILFSYSICLHLHTIMYTITYGINKHKVLQFGKNQWLELFMRKNSVVKNFRLSRLQVIIKCLIFVIRGIRQKFFHAEFFPNYGIHQLAIQLYTISVLNFQVFIDMKVLSSQHYIHIVCLLFLLLAHQQAVNCRCYTQVTRIDIAFHHRVVIVPALQHSHSTGMLKLCYINFLYPTIALGRYT